MPAELEAAEQVVAHQSASARNATISERSTQAPVDPIVLGVAPPNSRHHAADKAGTPRVSVNTQPLQPQIAAARSVLSAVPLLGGDALTLPQTATAGRTLSCHQGTPFLSLTGQGLYWVGITATVNKYNFFVLALVFNHVSWAEFNYKSLTVQCNR